MARRRVRQIVDYSGIAALAVALFLLLNMAPLGCTTRITPPADLSEARTVFLLDHGRTPSLVLPTADDRLVRYAYGDWRYYALGDRGSGSGLAAVFWPTQAALGRHEVPGPLTEQTARRAAGVGVEWVHAIAVERSRVQRLRRRLDELLEKNADTLVFNKGANLWFVHHPESYTYWHNSNHQTADWLRELGCEVRGPAYYSRWQIRSPPDRAGGP